MAHLVQVVHDVLLWVDEESRISDVVRHQASSPISGRTKPLGEAEALALLGVAPGCTPEELAHAYHLTMSQWHPDKLETMAPELREYATRRTVRINEAYQKLKSTTV
jgi:DnaJ-domain-containing protein 1